MLSRSKPSRPSANILGHLGALVAVCLLPLVGGCLQAETRGGEAPDQVVIVGTPTWNNGVSAIFALKCAVCHSVPKPDIAPSGTPLDMNFNQQDLVGTTRGANDAIPAIVAGILQHPVGDLNGVPLMPDSMPLPFATPLTAGEVAALGTWVLTSPPAATSTDGLTLYAYYCQGCHGVQGRGGRAMAVYSPGNEAQIDTDTTLAIGGTVQSMTLWPGLTSLSGAEITAISTYLATP